MAPAASSAHRSPRRIAATCAAPIRKSSTPSRTAIVGTQMPPYAGQFTDDQIWRITAYIRGLRGTAIDTPAAGDVAGGEAIFWGKGNCGSCHMVKGQGQHSRTRSFESCGHPQGAEHRRRADQGKSQDRRRWRYARHDAAADDDVSARAHHDGGWKSRFQAFSRTKTASRCRCWGRTISISIDSNETT